MDMEALWNDLPDLLERSDFLAILTQKRSR